MNSVAHLDPIRAPSSLLTLAIGMYFAATRNPALWADAGVVFDELAVVPDVAQLDAVTYRILAVVCRARGRLEGQAGRHGGGDRESRH
jgi:hypothetical protein